MSRKTTPTGQPEGSMTPMPENPMHEAAVWVRCKVRVTQSYHGLPVYWVGPEGFEVVPLEAVEWIHDRDFGRGRPK